LTTPPWSSPEASLSLSLYHARDLYHEFLIFIWIGIIGPATEAATARQEAEDATLIRQAAKTTKTILYRPLRFLIFTSSS
jgi:hypothetical protein